MGASPEGKGLTRAIGYGGEVEFLELACDALRESQRDPKRNIVARESEQSLVRTGMFRAELDLRPNTKK